MQPKLNYFPVLIVLEVFVNIAELKLHKLTSAGVHNCLLCRMSYLARHAVAELLSAVRALSGQEQKSLH